MLLCDSDKCHARKVSVVPHSKGSVAYRPADESEVVSDMRVEKLAFAEAVLQRRECFRWHLFVGVATSRLKNDQQPPAGGVVRKRANDSGRHRMLGSDKRFSARSAGRKITVLAPCKPGCRQLHDCSVGIVLLTAKIKHLGWYLEHRLLVWTLALAATTLNRGTS
jgi:hypothetical protein